jgi:hypothetical protein
MKRMGAPLVAGLTLLVWAACKDDGVLYLTSVNEEPAGANCVDGGSKLNFGADQDADGQLATSEVSASAYVCNGAASRGATVTSTALQPGDSDCPQGGYVLHMGVDRNANGAIDADEGGTTRKICNGGAGAAGGEGPAGEHGTAGPQGPVGDAGVPGEQGPQGYSGEQGPQGDAAPQGVPGEQGEPGVPGDAGVNGFNSLVLLTPEPIGEECLEPGSRMDVGLDNGDGEGVAGDGTLQPGEIDQTAFLCKLAPVHFRNHSFETGDFRSWIIQDLEDPYNPLQVSADAATDGSFGALTGFDGGGSPGAEIFIGQDLDLTGFSTVFVSFDWAVTQCELAPYGATIDRTFSLVVEPSGGGTPLFTQDLFTCPAGVDTTHAPVDDETVDISSVADQPVRIKFRWLVPENFTGPAESHVDDVKLILPP